MKRKVSTLLEPAVYQRVKMQALIQQKQINEIIGEALEHYLRAHGSAPHASVAASSWGAIPLDRAGVRQILEDEDGLWDA